MSDYTNTNVVPENYFNDWFRKIDKDGDGKIDMIEMAHGISSLKANMPPVAPPKRDK